MTRIFKFCIALSLVFFLGSLAAKADSTPRVKVKKINVENLGQKISSVIQIRERIQKKMELAEEESSEDKVKKVNCLLTKLNLVKGLLKASKHARTVILDALNEKDSKTAFVFQGKLNSYAESAKEVEKSIGECGKGFEAQEGTTLVYIRPEGEGEPPSSETSPWDWNYAEGTEAFPTVPAASPFR